MKTEDEPKGPAAADWTEADPAARGLRAEAVAAALDAGAAIPGLRALVAARHGALVAERYYGGAKAEDLQAVNSATKSVCALLVGLAQQAGALPDLDRTVADLLPEAVAEVPDAPVAAVTLREILQGRSNLVFDPALFGRLGTAKPMVNFLLAHAGEPTAGPGWSYNDAVVALLAPLLQRAQGADLAALAKRQLFDAMGIARFQWRRDRSGHAIAPAGLMLRPRDLLKLAQLMLDGGLWQGQRLLPEAWVTECLQPQIEASWRAGPVEDVGYGLLWFTGRLHGHRVAWAWGYGGQFALLVPALSLVVATAATAPLPAALREQTDALMSLVAAMVEAAG